MISEWLFTPFAFPFDSFSSPFLIPQFLFLPSFVSFILLHFLSTQKRKKERTSQKNQRKEKREKDQKKKSAFQQIKKSTTRPKQTQKPLLLSQTDLEQQRALHVHLISEHFPAGGSEFERAG